MHGLEENMKARRKLEYKENILKVQIFRSEENSMARKEF